MKLMRYFLLGSSVGLFVTGGAQAADLPVKAKAVEYVKICSLYGAGFYYIPGTDTCIKLGGYLRVETGLATNTSYDVGNASVAGARNRLSNYYYARSREDLNIDTRTATEYGVVRTYFDAVFTWTSGVYNGNGAAPGATVYQSLGGGGTVAPASAPQNANPGAVAGGVLGVFQAFIQFAGFTMGKTVSQFAAPWTAYPANNFDGLPGGINTTTGVNQFTYTADFGRASGGGLGAGSGRLRYHQPVERQPCVQQWPPERCVRLERLRRLALAGPRWHGPRRPGLGSVPGVGCRA